MPEMEKSIYIEKSREKNCQPSDYLLFWINPYSLLRAFKMKLQTFQQELVMRDEEALFKVP